MTIIKKTIETIVAALNRIEKKKEKKTQMSLHLSKILYNIIPSQIKKKNQPPNFIQSQSEPSKEVTLSQSWF